MAPISAYHFFTLLLLISTVTMSSVHSERLNPQVAAGCWKEIYQVPQCAFRIIKAFIFNGSIDDVGVPCCRAFLSLTGDCQVEIFQNSTVIPLIETFCTTIVGSADSPPLPPTAPAPGVEISMPPAAPVPGGETPPVVAEPPLAPTSQSHAAEMSDVEFGNEKRTSTFPWATTRLV